MLQSLFRTLARRWTNRTRSASPVRSPRASSFRPQLEGLENRLVLSVAGLSPNGFLDISADGGTPSQTDAVVLQAIKPAAGQPTTRMEVYEEIGNTQTPLGTFAINQIKGVVANTEGHTSFNLDYVNGPMFNKGITATFECELIGLPDTAASNSAFNNAFNVELGKFNETETLTLSGTGGLSTLTLGGDTFQFDSTYTSVDDQSTNTGNFFVHTPAKQITVTEGGVVNLADVITSLGLPAVSFFNKTNFHLEMDGPSGSVLTVASMGSAACQTFSVDMNAANDKVELNEQHAGVFSVIDAHDANDVIDVAPQTDTLADIGGNVAVVNASSSAATLNVNNQKHGSYPFAISVRQGPVKVNLFEGTLARSFTVTSSDSNVLSGPA